MNAESREAVFQALRQQGIKAIKVVAADGSKANGEVRGVRKRAVAAIVALVALGVGVAAYVGGPRSGAPVAADPAKMSPRHQIYGDPAIMDGLERGDFGTALSRNGDRLLACHAQPGKFMCPRGFTPRRLGTDDEAAFAHYAKEELAVERDIEINAADSREIRELKQIVNGIRQELRDYLANGNGTPRSFWRRLNERTVQEMLIYERTRRELEHEKNPAVWEAKNDALRRLGLRTIPTAGEGEL